MTSQTHLRPAASPSPWAFEESDLAPDPRIEFFSLKNGMRVAWAKHSEPNERVYLRLHVDVGSLAEEDKERGMAHFLEHMAFNGSDNFASGTLVQWFQEHGMSFGADTNAHTSFSETVYKLDLPTNSEKTIREGLTVLRDFASKLHLRDEDVQAEKGVIDGEERERENAGMRAFIALMENQYAGTRLPARLPIGIKEARDAFDDKLVRGFYERWYRPENMTLVVVGDLGDWNLETLVRDEFDDMNGPDYPVDPEPPMGTPTMDKMRISVADEEIPVCQMMVSKLRPFVERPDNAQERRNNVRLSVAHAILGLRFSEALKRPGTAFLEANASEQGTLKVLEGGELTIVTEPSQWEAGLRQCILELRGALEFGFGQAELDEVRASMLRQLEEAVERQATTDSRVLLQAILTMVEHGHVSMSPEAEFALHGDILNSLTTEEVQAGLKEIWEGGELSLVAIGNLAHPGQAKEMERVFEAAMQEELVAPEEEAQIPFAYATEGTGTEPVTRLSQVKDLKVIQIEMANGVRLNIKQTDYKDREVLVRARLGNGLMGMSTGELPIAQVAQEVFLAGGLTAHDASALRRMFAGKQASLTFQIKEDHIELACTTNAKDLQAALDLLSAYLQHAEYRDDALPSLRANLPVLYEQLQHSPNGPFLEDFLPEFIQGNPRFRWLNMAPLIHPKHLLSVSMDEVRTLLEPRLTHAPIELSVVGDIEPQAVLTAVSQTLGALPERGDASVQSRGRFPITMQSGVAMEREIETKDERATLFLTYPTTDGLDDDLRRQLFFLGQVVADRLRLEVRERLGAAYSPFAASQSSRIFTGLGGILIQASGSPEQVDTLVSACRKVCQDLADDGVQAAEVTRLAEPLQNALRDHRRTNEYWLDAIAMSQADPTTLDAVRTIESFYANVDPAVISELASQFLTEDKASQLVVLPKTHSENE